jgi:hypothetical protein
LVERLERRCFPVRVEGTLRMMHSSSFRAQAHLPLLVDFCLITENVIVFQRSMLAERFAGCAIAASRRFA